MTDDVDWQPGIVFTHTLSLTLDDKAQEILQSIRDQLMAVGVPVLHQPAHITVAAVSTMEGVDSHLVDVGWPERITLTKSCRLPNSDGVVGLCPHDPTSSDPVTIFDTSSEGEPELCSAPPSVGSFRALTCLPEDLMSCCTGGWLRRGSSLSTITALGGGTPTSRWGIKFRPNYKGEPSELSLAWGLWKWG